MMDKLFVVGFLFLIIGTVLLMPTNSRENAAGESINPRLMAFGNDPGLMYAIYAFVLGILVLVILTRIGVL